MKLISFEDVEPHMRDTLFITGSFCVAWSWDLVMYAASHAWNSESPMHDQIGFGGNGKDGPKFLIVLLMEYLLVCGLAALLSNFLTKNYEDKKWLAAAIVAVEFVPSPFFSGKLMAYLGQFDNLDSVHQGLLNLLATAFAAFLAFAAQDLDLMELPPQLLRFRPILSETLGFGLGVAWNVFLMQLLAPEEMDTAHIFGLVGYLLVVLMIAFRLAAMLQDTATTSVEQQARHALLQKTLSMASFAFNVVSAFTTVALVNALVATGWVGDVLSLLVLICLAAILSAVVASVDTESTGEQYTRIEEGDTDHNCGFGSGGTFDFLVFVPCFWFCCPWIPLLWLLMGVTPDIHVKERWHKLIAFVLGLASSIQGSGMLTKATDSLSEMLGICGSKHCHHPWLFVVYEILLAVLATAILLPLLGLISNQRLVDTQGELREAEGERQPLIQEAERRPRRMSIRRSFQRLKESLGRGSGRRQNQPTQ